MASSYFMKTSAGRGSTNRAKAYRLDAIVEVEKQHGGGGKHVAKLHISQRTLPPQLILLIVCPTKKK